jgi:hypothetical protein
MESTDSNSLRIIKARFVRDLKLQSLIDKALRRKTFEVMGLQAIEVHKHLPGLTEINGKLKILNFEYDENNRIMIVYFLHENIAYRVNGDRFLKIQAIKEIISNIKSLYYER